MIVNGSGRRETSWFGERMSGMRLECSAKDLTGTLANSRSVRQLRKRIFCNNKAKEIPALYLHKYILQRECDRDRVT